MKTLQKNGIPLFELQRIHVVIAFVLTIVSVDVWKRAEHQRAKEGTIVDG